MTSSIETPRLCGLLGKRSGPLDVHARQYGGGAVRAAALQGGLHQGVRLCSGLGVAVHDLQHLVLSQGLPEPVAAQQQDVAGQ